MKWSARKERETGKAREDVPNGVSRHGRETRAGNKAGTVRCVTSSLAPSRELGSTGKTRFSNTHHAHTNTETERDSLWKFTIGWDGWWWRPCSRAATAPILFLSFSLSSTIFVKRTFLPPHVHRPPALTVSPPYLPSLQRDRAFPSAGTWRWTRWNPPLLFSLFHLFLSLFLSYSLFPPTLSQSSWLSADKIFPLRSPRIRCATAIAPLDTTYSPSTVTNAQLLHLPPPFLGPRDVILERFVRVLYIRLSAVPCRRHIPYLRRFPCVNVGVCVGRNQDARNVAIAYVCPIIVCHWVLKIFV